MNTITQRPTRLFHDDGKINLYCLNEIYKYVAETVCRRLSEEDGIDISISSGMWGGSYLVADESGRARTFLKRLYCLVNLPQNTPLDQENNFEKLMQYYCDTLQNTFKFYNLTFVEPRWGEPVPYTNHKRPTTAMQLWERDKKVAFLRAFFVWNSASWEDSIIYDTIRNIKVLKELLDINRRPPKKTTEEYKFLLQDVLIIYYTLENALTPDFREHAEPIMEQLLEKFLGGMHDPELVEKQFEIVYTNAIVYGFDEALEGPYGKDNLNIHKVEEWPVDKINWVPRELKNKLADPLKEKFSGFRTNLLKTDWH